MIDKKKLKELEYYCDQLKVISSTKPLLACNSQFLKVATSNHVLANNKMITREEIVKKNDNAVIIIPVTTEGNILLVIQPRPLTKEGVTIELPAGYIDDDESGYEAALRELCEETGYVPNDGVIRIGTFYQDQGCSRGINEAYVAFGCEKVKEQSLDKDEYIKYIECRFEEVEELIKSGYIKSANSLLTFKLGEKDVLKHLRKTKILSKKEADLC